MQHTSIPDETAQKRSVTEPGAAGGLPRPERPVAGFGEPPTGLKEGGKGEGLKGTCWRSIMFCLRCVACWRTKAPKRAHGPNKSTTVAPGGPRAGKGADMRLVGKRGGLFISQVPNPPPSACTTEQQQWVGLAEPISSGFSFSFQRQTAPRKRPRSAWFLTPRTRRDTAEVGSEVCFARWCLP